MLLDHGLYKTISEKFRISFARFYKACVLNRLDLVEKYAKEIGITDWKMAALIILMRPIDVEFAFSLALSPHVQALVLECRAE